MPNQIKLFDLYKDQIPETSKIVTDTQFFTTMMNQLHQNNILAFDTETSGLKYFAHASICGASFAVRDGDQLKSWYVPCRHRTGEVQLSPEIVLAGVKELLEDQNKLIIGHNSKFEKHMTHKEGINWLAKMYCTYTAARQYNENDRLGLKHRAVTDLNIPDAENLEKSIDKEIAVLAKGRGLDTKKYKDLYGYSEISINHGGIYSCLDSEFSYALYEKYEKLGLSKRISRVWNTEMALIPIIADMEEYGLRIDRPYILWLKNDLTDKKTKIDTQIRAILGKDYFDLASDPQLIDYLQNGMKLNLTKTTKKLHLSVDREALEPFIEQDKTGFIKLLLELRDVEKYLSTYTDTLLEHTDSNDILHGELNAMGTNTGRFSSSNPNLQNNPDDPVIRRIFLVRDPDSVMIMPDYSQIEIRILAHVTQEPKLINAFRNNEDLHTRTAAEVFNVSMSEVTKDQRFKAKTINFGLQYGITQMGLSRQLKTSEDEAAGYLNKYYSRFSKVKAYKEQFIQQIRKNKGIFKGIFGREYHSPDINHYKEYIRGKAERGAFSKLVQGGAAELTKESMVESDSFYKREGLSARLCNTIHDEIWVSVPKKEFAYVTDNTKKIMENFREISVPIVVDVSYTTTNWADKKKIVM